MCRECGFRDPLSARDAHLGDVWGTCQRCEEAGYEVERNRYRAEGHAAGVAEERARVVAWLRGGASFGPAEEIVQLVADAIEKLP